MIDIIHAMHPLPDERKHAVDLLQKYGMIELFEKAQNDFDEAFATCKADHKMSVDSSLNSIVENLLTTINETVGGITDPNEKRALKTIIGKLGNHLMEKSIIPNMPQKALKQLTQSIKTFFEKKNYSFEDLTLYINMGQDNANLPVKITSEAAGYFEWNGNKKQWKELERQFLAGDYIKSKIELRNKFHPKKANQQIRFNAEKRDAILVLFQELVRSKVKLINCKKTKGVFHILSQGAVDFNGNKFMEKEPKRYMEEINKNEEKACELKANANRIINEIKRTL
jgi:hypothetical protein